MPRMMKVRPDFPCDRLFPQEECYFRLPGRMVMVQGNGTPALVFFRSGRLICDCPEAQMDDGECRHTRALGAGLWAHVFMCPQGHGIVTRTGDWLQGVGCPSALPWRVALESPVTVC